MPEELYFVNEIEVSFFDDYISHFSWNLLHEKLVSLVVLLLLVVLDVKHHSSEQV
jgi:hypothetical protein